MSRVRRRRHREQPPPCPTPEKIVYRSPAHARRAQRERRLPCGLKDHLHPYPCPAGHWHLTHQTPAEQTQIAARIARKANTQ